MEQGFKNSWNLLMASIKSLLKYPHLLIPLIAVWLIFAPIVIYIRFEFKRDYYPIELIYVIIFLMIFVYSFLLTLSCSVLLELIQQKETGKPFNLFKSLGETFRKNFKAILILTLIWAVIWFVLTLIEAFLKKNKKSKTTSLTADDITSSIAHSNKFTNIDGTTDTSGISFSFSALKKGLRMIVFLIMPAIAWEDLNFKESYKRGVGILKIRATELIAGYTLSSVISAIVIIPPVLFFFILKFIPGNPPSWCYFIIMIYFSLSTSFSIYLEQMFTAELFMWQMKWEHEVRKAEQEGRMPPAFNEVEKPIILDNFPDQLFD